MFSNIGRSLRVSLLAIGIGVVLVIISVILRLISAIVTGDYSELLSQISIFYELVSIPMFLVLYLWTGLRAVKASGLDVVGAGMAAAIASFITGFISLVLQILLSLLMVGHVITGTGFISTEAVLAASLFGETAAGSVGIGLSSLCGFAILILASLINFVVGGCGGILAHKQRTFS